MKKAAFWFLLAVGLTALFQPECFAIPNYARNLKVDCTLCHSVRPQLNATGRLFLLTGGESLKTEPFGGVQLSTDILGGRLRSEWVDKRFSMDSKTDVTDDTLRVKPISSGQGFLSGRAEKAFYYSLVEADTHLDGELVRAYILYPLTQKVLFYGGYASPFAIDGYDTVRHRPILRRDWSGAAFVPGTTQMIGIHGSYGNFSGMASLHGDDDDPSGSDPESFSLRMTYSSSPSHAFGAYFTDGRRFDETVGRATDDYRFYGVDASFHFGHANLLFLAAVRDEGGKKDDNVSLEFSYTFPLSEDGLIKAVIPVVSLDTFTRELTNDGRFVQGAVGAVLRITHWFRFIPSVEGTLKAPSDFKHKDLRFAVTGDLAF